MLVSVSSMPAGKNYMEYVKQIESFADFFHLDVCDGIYNETKCFSPAFAKEINSNSTLPLDCHLMTKNALKFAKEYIDARVNILTCQIESFENESQILEYINYVKHGNTLCGLSLEPQTPISRILPYLEKLDVVLLMSVKTGKRGQKFENAVFEKIQQLATLRQEKNLKYKIEVDGGIDNEIAQKIKEFGVDIVVSGSFVFNSTNKKESVDLLK